MLFIHIMHSKQGFIIMGPVVVNSYYSADTALT